MPYVRRTWQNAPSSATPLNAAALNNIETGIEEALAKPGATDAAVEAIIADTDSDTYATLSSAIGSVVDEKLDDNAAVIAAASSAAATALAESYASFTLIEEPVSAMADIAASTAGGTPNYGTPPKFGTSALGYGGVKVNEAIAEQAQITVEFWLYLNTSADTAVRVCWAIGPNLWLAFLNQPRVLRLALNGTTTAVDSTTTVSAAVYHHVAVQLTRSTLGGSNSLHSWYLDGVAMSPASGGPGSSAWDESFTMGSLSSGGSSVAGLARVDEFRVSSGHRYSGNFTPPTTAFTADASTLVLAHMEDATTSVRGVTGVSYPTRPSVPSGLVTYVGATTPTDALDLDAWRRV